MTIDEINDLITESKMQLNFDALSVAPSTGGTSSFFPLGDYPFVVTKVESKQVKDKQAGMLEVTLQVTDGPFKGATLVDRFNLWNPSTKAVEIAYSQLSSLCRVTGRVRLVNDTDLIGGVGIGTFGPQMENGEPSNKYSEVKQYKDMQGRVNGAGEPVAAPQPVQAATAVASAPTGAAPWSAPAQPQPQQPQQPAAPAQGQMPWQQPAAPAQGAAAPPSTGWQTGAPAQQPSAPGGNIPPWAQPQQ